MEAEKLKHLIAEALGISVDEMMQHRGKRITTDALCIYAYLRRKPGLATYEKIGKELNRNHSTIIYYVRRYVDSVKYSHQFRELTKMVNDLIIKK